MRKLLLLLLLGCDDTTTLVVKNAYSDPGVTLTKLWWQPTYVAETIAAGVESTAYRTVPGDDYAYALITRGGDPIVVRSIGKLGVERGNQLEIVIAPGKIIGDCATTAPLTQAEADLVTQSIFPEDFAGANYDATKCVTVRPK
jgi:hypothetical protein